VSLRNCPKCGHGVIEGPYLNAHMSTNDFQCPECKSTLFMDPMLPAGFQFAFAVIVVLLRFEGGLRPWSPMGSMVWALAVFVLLFPIMQSIFYFFGKWRLPGETTNCRALQLFQGIIVGLWLCAVTMILITIRDFSNTHQAVAWFSAALAAVLVYMAFEPTRKFLKVRKYLRAR
jgi:ribosomal protein S27AE